MDLKFFYGNTGASLHDADLAMAAIPKPTCYADYGKTWTALPGGDFVENMPEDVYLDCPDDYEHLPAKVVAICRWAIEQGYDWMLKADDDTYIWPQRALEEIRWKQWDYAGYSAHLGSISGGPGYWLSKRAMALVAESEPHTWAEDKCVEEVMSRNHVKAIQLNATHLCGLIEHWVDISRDLSGAVTAHAVKAGDMRAIYAREHANRP